jgi:hypothetical protein
VRYCLPRDEPQANREGVLPVSVPPEVSVDLSIPSLGVNFRPGVSLSTTTGELGPLADLAGTWVGTGLNLISLPDFDSTPPSTGPAPFRLKLNSTVEILEFTPIGAGVPNRGVITSPPGQQPVTGQPDINLFGLRYLQRVADAVTHEPLHIEPGFWLNVPNTLVPPAVHTVVRQGSIPHGTSLLAMGTGGPSRTGLPIIGDIDSTPVKNPNVPPPLDAEYLMPVAARFRFFFYPESEPGPQGGDPGADHQEYGGAANFYGFRPVRRPPQHSVPCRQC